VKPLRFRAIDEKPEDFYGKTQPLTSSELKELTTLSPEEERFLRLPPAFVTLRMREKPSGTKRSATMGSTHLPNKRIVL